MLVPAFRVCRKKKIQGVGTRKLLPAPEAALELCRPLSKPLRELTPRELDVLQLVYNHASLQEMCDHSLIDDVEIAQAVLDLLRKDYIRGS